MSPLSPAARVVEGEGSLVAAAIHDGHGVRPDVQALLAIDDAQRLREEDPFTSTWTTVAPTRIVGLQSRFEVDLNRPRDRCVYLSPDQAWGLNVWRSPPPPQIVEASRRMHDTFYAQVRSLLDEKVRRHGRFVVLDIHSYNHRRAGADAPPADTDTHPDFNVGTAHLPRHWAALARGLMEDLGHGTLRGRRLHVRENVPFGGGFLSQWVNATYPRTGCALSIEVKKIFMDEWTGAGDAAAIEAIGHIINSAAAGVVRRLAQIGGKHGAG